VGVNRIDQIALNNTCPCTSGYYDTGATSCLQCHYSCAECSGPLINNCTVCPSPATSFRIDTISTNNRCDCPTVGYFDNNVKNCVICHFSCLTCSVTFDHCDTCSSTNKRSISAGNNCTCDSGYYESGAALCATCHHSC
jgi:hypothetical protein